MRIEVTMENERELRVASWWAKSPTFVVNTLRSQLEAAQAVWPELREFELSAKAKD